MHNAALGGKAAGIDVADLLLQNPIPIITENNITGCYPCNNDVSENSSHQLPMSRRPYQLLTTMNADRNIILC